MLRPFHRLNLREHQTVRIDITPIKAPSESEKVLQALAASGFVTLSSETTTIEPVSEERREELARIFSVGKPLSELIIEERGAGW
jgi:hypothetical protein